MESAMEYNGKSHLLPDKQWDDVFHEYEITLHA